MGGAAMSLTVATLALAFIVYSVVQAFLGGDQRNLLWVGFIKYITMGAFVTMPFWYDWGAGIITLCSNLVPFWYQDMHCTITLWY